MLSILQLKGANVKSVDRQDKTALHLAAFMVRGGGAGIRGVKGMVGWLIGVEGEECGLIGMGWWPLGDDCLLLTSFSS